LLAKTFWCKNTNYKLPQVEEQFAGILNGLKTNISHVPVLRALYRNPVYLRWAHTEMIRQKYNEYSTEEHECSPETIKWFCRMYDVSVEQIEDAERHLSTANFPIALEGDIYEQMIKTDWSRTPLPIINWPT
jgi:hypothetical protein